jgi:hypothetical protein
MLFGDMVLGMIAGVGAGTVMSVVFEALRAVLGIWLAPGSSWTTLFVICGAVNASGAIGDLWMTRIALRYPSAARILDERDGMRVFVLHGPPSDRPGLQRLWHRVARYRRVGSGLR